MRILIELPTWLGDCVMATPAIENIVNTHPKAQVLFLGSFVAVEAMKFHPQIEQIAVLNKSYGSLYKTARDLGKFDVFISFRSSTRSQVLKFFVSAEQKYQFNKHVYAQGHQVEKYNNFIRDSLSINLKPNKLKLYTQSDIPNVGQRPTLGVNPGASYGSAKRWYPEQFSKLAIKLSNKYDIVIFGGPSEIDIASDIEKLLIKNSITNYQNLAGKTSISELVDKVSNLDLFITGDSGPMHVAAAFQIPTVAIFGPTKDDETSQWMNEKSIIVKKNLDCQPCMKRACPLQHHNCMRLIDADKVLTAVKQLNL